MENKYWADSTIPRDPARIDEILLLLGDVWKTEPDLRLGQLIFALTPLGMDPFFLEDDDLKSILLTNKVRREQKQSEDFVTGLKCFSSNWLKEDVGSALDLPENTVTKCNFQDQVPQD